jgi:polyferredoxin
MDKMGYARGLVRYNTQHALDHKTTRVIRPRVVVYGVLLTLLIAGFIAALAIRKPLALDVLHDRNTLYRNLDSGEIENVYLLKIMNKAEQPRRFVVSLAEAGEYRLDPERPVFEVSAGEVFNAAIRVRRDAWREDLDSDSIDSQRSTERRSEAIRLTITALDDRSLQASAESRFFAPSP